MKKFAEYQYLIKSGLAQQDQGAGIFSACPAKLLRLRRSGFDDRDSTQKVKKGEGSMSKTKEPEIRVKESDIDRLLMLTKAQLKVWLWYKSHEDKDGRAYGEARTIGKDCNLVSSTVKNTRSWLTRNGWLLRREEAGNVLPLFLAVIPEYDLIPQNVEAGEPNE